jgi:hypothetical protein
MSKKKQFLSEAIRLVGYHNDAYKPEERIRRALVRAYKKGVKDGQSELRGVWAVWRNGALDSLWIDQNNASQRAFDIDGMVTTKSLNSFVDISTKSDIMETK